MEASVCKTLTLSARMSTVQDAGVQRARICALEDLWVNCPRLLLAWAWVPWPSTRLWARWQQRDGHASATRVGARPPLAAHGQGYEARSRMPKPRKAPRWRRAGRARCNHAMMRPTAGSVGNALSHARSAQRWGAAVCAPDMDNFVSIYVRGRGFRFKSCSALLSARRSRVMRWARRHASRASRMSPSSLAPPGLARASSLWNR